MSAIDDFEINTIRQYFYIDDSGNVRNKIDRGGKAKKDQIAGRIHWSNAKNAYRKIGIGAREYRAHRIAWAIHYGEYPQGIVDHINHDGLNNHPDNLRVVTESENIRNRSHGHGIHQWKGGWYAQAIDGQHSVRKGLFATKTEAANAVKKLYELLNNIHENALPLENIA